MMVYYPVELKKGFMKNIAMLFTTYNPEVQQDVSDWLSALLLWKKDCYY